MAVVVNPWNIKTLDEVKELVETILHHAEKNGLKPWHTVFELIEESGVYGYCEDCSERGSEDREPTRDESRD